MFKDLYFIDVRKTVDLIVENKLTDAIALKYLITISVLFGALIQVPIDYEESDGGIISVALAIAAFALKGFVSYKGVIACKAANDLADGLYFFRRFIVLSVPVGVSMTIVYIVVVLTLAFFLPAFGPYPANESSLMVLFTLVDIGYTAIFFVYLSKAFAKLSVGNV